MGRPKSAKKKDEPKVAAASAATPILKPADRGRLSDFLAGATTTTTPDDASTKPATKRTHPARAVPSSAVLQAEMTRLTGRPEHDEMLRLRQVLPAFEHRSMLLDTIARHRVTLVRGATGCGKSTQLPQLLLEQAAASAEPCHILVAQPLRDRR